MRRLHHLPRGAPRHRGHPGKDPRRAGRPGLPEPAHGRLRRNDRVMVMAMTDDSALIAAPCHGEQGAFAQLVGKYSPAMLRVAGSYVPSDAVAEEVVQETWIALVNGIATFEGRSCLQTWLFVATISIAKTFGAKEQRNQDAPIAPMGPSVDPARFHGPDDPRAGSWKQPPAGFPDTLERSVLGQELRTIAQRSWTSYLSANAPSSPHRIGSIGDRDFSGPSLGFWPPHRR